MLRRGFDDGRDDNDTTVWLLAFRNRRHTFDGIDGVVHYLAVRRRHWLEGALYIARLDFGGDALSKAGQSLLPASSVPVDIDDEPTIAR
jgi:hypothetical protein